MVYDYLEVIVKRTVFLLCEECDNIFLSTNLIVAEKKLVCGQGCGGELKTITKQEACIHYQEKNENER